MAGSTSASAPAGTSPSTTPSGSRSSPSAGASARLAEAVAVLKGCFADGPFTFRGEHYRSPTTTASPSRASDPTRRSSSVAAVAGRSRLAAREANVVGLAPRILPGPKSDPHSLTVAATEEKIGWVREAAGDRFDELELNVYPSTWPVTITDHARAEADRVIDSPARAAPASS